MSGSGGSQGPDWYPDPYGRYELRYFDGTRWTEHVASHGRQSVDPPGGESRVPTVNRATEKIQADVAKANLGSINAENWRAWNFNIRDEQGEEVARMTKTWEGLAKTMFTTADNYVVQIGRVLDEPLRSLVVASALSVDTALKQDARGFG